jgi:hypothetical protein
MNDNTQTARLNAGDFITAIPRTVLLAVPLGEAVRNVLRTDTFRMLQRQPGIRLVILTQGARDADFCSEFQASNVAFERLERYNPSRLELALETLRLSTLHDESSTIQVFARREYGTWLSRVVPLTAFAMRLFGKQRLSEWLRWLNVRCVPADLYADVFARHQPDLVVVSRVLSYSADYPVLMQASRHRVPVVALTASWDNFTSKGFFPFGIARLVVWNEIMRREAIGLFQYPAEKVFVGGIARFDDFFRRCGIRTRDAFMRALGLDSRKKLITYATGHAQLGQPHQHRTPEPEIVAFLARAVEQNQLGFPAQLLVRLHPQANPDDYAHLVRSGLVRLHLPGTQSAFQDRDISLGENRLLGETMLHSDVVVNIASTITIDAAVFDTPVVCVAFDFGKPRSEIETVKRFYYFEHYRKLAACGGFRRADTPEALLAEIRSYLAEPSRDSEGRQRMVREQCTFTDGRSGERIGRFILDTLKEVSTGSRI